MPIRSFANSNVGMFFRTGRRPRTVAWTNASRIVARKLDMLHYAGKLLDLAAPPGNRLEALTGGWKGFHSIRVNDQFRVVFRWRDSGAEDVDVVDYH
ncbi:MAG: type II toxin-antitoxin system RelE/ParE family toxin [Acidobacteria bacterium]|nr:type II toxin-antitoxin system RelE/ParE family toxin [Acidobacteriota bacterium]